MTQNIHLRITPQQLIAAARDCEYLAANHPDAETKSKAYAAGQQLLELVKSLEAKLNAK